MKFITMRCPFHIEDTPSFSYNKKNGEFFCFGCGVKGNLFTDDDKFPLEAIQYIYSYIHPEWHVHGDPYEIVKQYKEYNPWLCDECFIPALIDRGKRVQCQNCGCENERMGFGEEDCLEWERYKAKTYGKLWRPFDDSR